MLVESGVGMEVGESRHVDVAVVLEDVFVTLIGVVAAGLEVVLEAIVVLDGVLESLALLDVTVEVVATTEDVVVGKKVDEVDDVDVTLVDPPVRTRRT